MLFKTAREKPDGFDLMLEGGPVRVRLVRRANARRCVLKVASASRDVRLTVPPGESMRRARAFAERHGDWILERLRGLPPPVPLEDGAVLPFAGEPHVIEHRPQARGTVWIEPGDSAPLLPEDAYPRLCVAGRYLHLRRRLRDWLEDQARERLTVSARAYARRLGVSFRRISIRDQKSRWGACSASGTLTFSWRLILAPPHVLDYLAAHEVTHIRQMNHSPAFWRTVRELCAETDRAEAWLKRNGPDLHRYDPAD
jgi:hypothetical protein